MTDDAARAESTPRTVTLAEVARALQISDDTVRRNLPILLRMGLYELPRFGHQRRFSAASLAALIDGKSYRDRRHQPDRRRAPRVA